MTEVAEDFHPQAVEKFVEGVENPDIASMSIKRRIWNTFKKRSKYCKKAAKNNYLSREKRRAAPGHWRFVSGRGLLHVQKDQWSSVFSAAGADRELSVEKYWVRMPAATEAREPPEEPRSATRQMAI